MTTKRVASITRDTRETKISVDLDLDGQGQATLEMGVPFLEHMLDQVARHGMFEPNYQSKGRP